MGICYSKSHWNVEPGHGCQTSALSSCRAPGRAGVPLLWLWGSSAMPCPCLCPFLTQPQVTPSRDREAGACPGSDRGVLVVAWCPRGVGWPCCGRGHPHPALGVDNPNALWAALLAVTVLGPLPCSLWGRNRFGECPRVLPTASCTPAVLGSAATRACFTPTQILGLLQLLEPSPHSSTPGFCCLPNWLGERQGEGISW